jgi:DNA mismatch repair protein MutS
LQVARLAGVPHGVLDRARQILANLEAMAIDPDSEPRLARGPSGRRRAAQLSLFAAPSASEPAPPPSDPLREALAAVNPDDLSPRAAHELLYRLKKLAEARRPG